jgi:hypothetical protein
MGNNAIVAILLRMQDDRMRFPDSPLILGRSYSVITSGLHPENSD